MLIPTKIGCPDIRHPLAPGIAICLALILGTLQAGYVQASEFKEARKTAKQIAADYQAPPEIVIDSSSTLDDYLRYAALNNPGLRSAFYTWKSELDQVGVVRGLPDPMFSYGYFIENVETRVGPQQQRFSVSQNFPWFGTLAARGDMTFQGAGAAYQRYQAAKLKLYYEVKAAYYDYYLLGRKIQLAQDHIQLLNDWEEVALTRYKSAIGSYHNIIQIQVELGKLEDQLISLQAMQRPTQARLLAVLNLPDSISLPIPGTIPDEQVDIDADSVKSQAQSYNPDLLALDNLIAKEKNGVSLAKKSSFPNFTLGVDYIQTGNALDPAMPESGKDPIVVFGSINLPIWFGKNKAARNQARSRYEAAVSGKANAENRLAAIVEKLLFEYGDAQRKVDLYRDGLIPRAQQSLNAALTDYQAGKAGFIDVIDAERLLLEFQLNLEESLTMRATKLAEIEMTTGREYGTK